MKILQINKFFYVRGGTSRYFFEVSSLLKSHGHEIAFFSMLDKHNFKSNWSKYFVSNISFDKIKFYQYPQIILRTLYSIEARKKITLLLDNFKPDIAHIHSIYHQISPSILLELKKRNIPIVQTLHDYHLISPNHTLFHNGRICEITKKRNYWKAIFHRCVKQSYSASFLESVEQYLHSISGLYLKNIDFFLAPSKFLINKFNEYDIPSEKIKVINNFCNYEKFLPVYHPGKYIIYFGRLSEEKGLNYLLDVMENLANIKLLIIGEGPLKNILKMKINNRNLKNVILLGRKNDVVLKKLISNSRFAILPSLCYEVFPFLVLESFALGKTVVASRIGGIPEIIKDGKNGLLFEPGNLNDCREKISKLWKNRYLCKMMGKKARNYVKVKFDQNKHYHQLMTVYKRAISSKN